MRHKHTLPIFCEKQFIYYVRHWNSYTITTSYKSNSNYNINKQLHNRLRGKETRCTYTGIKSHYHYVHIHVFMHRHIHDVTQVHNDWEWIVDKGREEIKREMKRRNAGKEATICTFTLRKYASHTSGLYLLSSQSTSSSNTTTIIMKLQT